MLQEIYLPVAGGHTLSCLEGKNLEHGEIRYRVLLYIDAVVDAVRHTRLGSNRH
jgi:hypothetical protein